MIEIADEVAARLLVRLVQKPGLIGRTNGDKGDAATVLAQEARLPGRHGMKGLVMLEPAGFGATHLREAANGPSLRQDM